MSNKEIEDLEKELQKLCLEFNRRTTIIKTRLADIRKRKQEEASGAADAFEDAIKELTQETFREGDWAEITNEYRYSEKGVRGKVTKINKPGDRVTIEDKKGNIYMHAPWNLRKLHKNS